MDRRFWVEEKAKVECFNTCDYTLSQIQGKLEFFGVEYDKEKGRNVLWNVLRKYVCEKVEKSIPEDLAVDKTQNVEDSNIQINRIVIEHRYIAFYNNDRKFLDIGIEECAICGKSHGINVPDLSYSYVNKHFKNITYDIEKSASANNAAFFIITFHDAEDMHVEIYNKSDDQHQLYCWANGPNYNFKEDI